MSGLAVQPRVRGYRASQLARRVRAMVSKAQGDICAICGTAMERNAQLAASHGEAVTLDHAIPLKRGGADALGNLIAAHNACNTAKSDRMPNGCELIWLLAVNARLGHGPVRW